MAKLTKERIEAMSDAQILMLTFAHPEKAGERVFAFTLRDFESRSEMAACMALLTVRLKNIVHTP